MRLNQRRATGSRVNCLLKATKKDFVELVKSKGLQFVILKENRGEWNEHRNFMVEGKVLHVAMKNESVDWDLLFNLVNKG